MRLGLPVVLLLLLAAPAHARLTFTRADGTPIAFRGPVKVSCGRWSQDSSRPALHIAQGGRKRHWSLDVVRRDIKLGTPLGFPNAFVFDKPRGAELFVADAPNEASTAGEDSSGSVTFARAGCRQGARVAFRIDAVLDSEFGNGDPVHVKGRFRAAVNA